MDDSTSAGKSSGFRARGGAPGAGRRSAGGPAASNCENGCDKIASASTSEALRVRDVRRDPSREPGPRAAAAAAAAAVAGGARLTEATTMVVCPSMMRSPSAMGDCSTSESFRSVAAGVCSPARTSHVPFLELSLNWRPLPSTTVKVPARQATGRTGPGHGRSRACGRGIAARFGRASRRSGHAEHRSPGRSRRQPLPRQRLTMHTRDARVLNLPGAVVRPAAHADGRSRRHAEMRSRARTVRDVQQCRHARRNLAPLRPPLPYCAWACRVAFPTARALRRGPVKELRVRQVGCLSAKRFSNSSCPFASVHSMSGSVR